MSGIYLRQAEIYVGGGPNEAVEKGLFYNFNATVQLRPNEIERAKRAYNSSADCCNRLLDLTGTALCVSVVSVDRTCSTPSSGAVGSFLDQVRRRPVGHYGFMPSRRRASMAS